MKEDIKFNDLPLLKVQNEGKYLQAVGHDGRHRARALKEAGYTHMPVRLDVDAGKNGYAIRWSEQHEGDFDFLTEWPRKVVSEDNDYVSKLKIPQGKAAEPWK